MILNKNREESAKALAEAIKTNDSAAMESAWANFEQAIVTDLKEQFAEVEKTNDRAVLAQRGFRQLTADEKAFYEKWIESAKGEDYKQAFTDLITVGGMPETIIEDVFKHLTEEHPLLNRINFQNVKYLTNWLLHDHTKDLAVWGEINDSITKEITSAFKNVEMKQGKLSAFVLIAKDMLDLGSTFLDNYVRTILAEALACGLEDGIINGIGIKGEPIGLIRDISADVEVNQSTGYPSKVAKAVTDFTPASYGALLSELAVTESGQARKFSTVQLIVNQADYLTKIMPATTVLNANGTYVNNVFPFPTEVIVSNMVDTGKAVLTLLPEYFMGVGMGKNGSILADDSVKFLEDQRAYKIKLFAAGRAADDTCALLLDISNVDPAYITVKNVDVTPEA